MSDTSVEIKEKDYIRLKNKIIKQCGENFEKEDEVLANYRMELLRFISDKKLTNKFSEGNVFSFGIRSMPFIPSRIFYGVSEYIENWRESKLELEKDITYFNMIQKSSYEYKMKEFLEKKLFILTEVYEKEFEEFWLYISKFAIWDKKNFIDYLNNVIKNDRTASYALEKYDMYERIFNMLSEIDVLLKDNFLHDKINYYIKYSKYACILLIKNAPGILWLKEMRNRSCHL